MKYHRHLVVEAISVLQKIFADDVYSDKAIESAMRAHPKWGSRDRHFVAETVYESVRWWRRVWHCLEEKPSTESAALFRFIGALWVLEGKDLPNWSEMANLDVNRILHISRKMSDRNPEFHSIPNWLHELGMKEIGADWPTVIAALNKKADVVLRVNILKTGMSELKKALAADEIFAEPIDGYPHALRLTKRANVFRTKAFQDGWFEVQDAASQKVVEMLEPKAGEKIVDACAGAGGKSLHMGSLMKNKGKIISLDIHQRKLDELRKRASRDGIDIIETRAIDSAKVIKRLENSADAVVLDVPCTGLGALRRNPDTKWKLTPENHQALLKTQAEILNSYSRMVKSKGRLVYATCSILPSEDEQQVSAFLKSTSGWELVKEHREWPHIQGFDGFYMALLRKLN